MKQYFIIYIIVFISILISCKKETNALIKKEIKNEDSLFKPFVYSKDSLIPPPTFKLLSGEKIKSVLQKENTTLYTNKVIAKALTILEIDKSKVVKIKYNEKKIDSKKIIDSLFILKKKEPRTTSPLKYKDDAMYDFQYLKSEEGLSASYIRDIKSDKNGFLYFITDIGGVNKYDGHTIIDYNKEIGLNNALISMLEDKYENLWFISEYNGVMKYNGNRISHYTSKNYLIRDEFSSAISDKSGNVWLASHGKGAIKFDGKSFFYFSTTNGLSDDYINNMLCDTKGNIWFTTIEGGITKFDGKYFTHYTTANGLPSNDVLCIAEDKNGNIWFGTDGGGLCKFDGDLLYNYTKKTGLAGDAVYSILIDNNTIWIGTTTGGITKYDGTYFTNYNQKHGLTNNCIFSIYKDNAENLWLGTWGGGVMKFNDKSFINHTLSNGLFDEHILSVFEDSKANLWLGTNSGKIMCIKDNQIRLLYESKDGLRNSVSGITEDNSGNIWFGTEGNGLLKYNGDFFVNYTTNDGLPTNYIRSAFTDKQGNLWVGTWACGVLKYDGMVFKTYSFEQGMSYNTIDVIEQDKEGNIWFGTNGGGFTIYDGNTFTQFLKRKGLSKHYITDIETTRDSSVWISTKDEGLIKYKNKKYIRYTISDKLSSNTIWSLTESKINNFLFIGTEKGLDIIDLKGKDFVKLSLNKKDGLKTEEFSRNCAIVTSGNIAYWGTSSSLTQLDLNKYKISTNAPKIIMTNIKINGKFIDYENFLESNKYSDNKEWSKINYDSVERFQNVPFNLKVPYNYNHLTFEFSAIDWAAPHKIKIQYKLDGLEQNWNSLTDDNFADYKNIPYGSYIFMVRAIGVAKKWSNVIEFKVTISPPWWKTIWFKSLVVAVLILSIYLIIKWRIEVVKKQQKIYSQKLLNSQDQERLRISRELHDSVGQSLLLLNITSKGQYHNEIVPIIDEVRLLSRNLSPNIDKKEFKEILEDLLENVKKESSIFFTYEIDPIYIQNTTTKLHIYRIIQEAISNIIKHSQAKNARIVLKNIKNNSIIISIYDDGIGFNVNEKHSKKTLGMTSMHERATLINANFSIISSTRGTQIKVTCNL